MLKLLLVVIVAAGCHRPSMKSRVKGFSTKVGALMAVVKPKVAVDIDAAAVLQAAQAQQQQRRSTDERPAQRERPSPSPTPLPDPIVKRTVAPPPTFVLRGETMGGTRICTKWTSMDECNADCTRQIRAATMAALSKDAGATRSCVCVEAKGC
jgi:hypothetical protein